MAADARIDVEEGLKELRSKQMIQIERETAIKWGTRAAASFRLAIEAGKLGERVRHLYEGENYRQEALEHGAMTEDFEFMQDIAEQIDEHRKDALTNIHDLLTMTDEDLGAPAEERGARSSRRTQRPGGKHRGKSEATATTGSSGGPAGARGEKYSSGVGRRR